MKTQISEENVIHLHIALGNLINLKESLRFSYFIGKHKSKYNVINIHISKKITYI